MGKVRTMDVAFHTSKQWQGRLASYQRERLAVLCAGCALVRTMNSLDGHGNLPHCTLEGGREGALLQAHLLSNCHRILCTQSAGQA